MTRALAAMTLALLLAACGGSKIRHEVKTPPPASPRTEFFLEKTQVDSRETGEGAWKRNEEYGRVLNENLRSALQERGKALVNPPADSIRARLYLGYGKGAIQVKRKGPKEERIEVRLELVESGSGAVRYSTHTIATLEPGTFANFGFGSDADKIIRDVLKKAADDFASRL